MSDKKDIPVKPSGSSAKQVLMEPTNLVTMRDRTTWLNFLRNFIGHKDISKELHHQLADCQEQFEREMIALETRMLQTTFAALSDKQAEQLLTIASKENWLG